MPHIGNEPGGAKFLRFVTASDFHQPDLFLALSASEHGVCDHANQPLTSKDQARERSFCCHRCAEGNDKGEFLTRAEEFLSHAARCNRLADICSDRAVAEKLRQLADYYRELAGQPSRHFHHIKTSPQSEAPQRSLGS